MAAPDVNPRNQAESGVDPRESLVEILRAIRRNAVRVVFTTLVCLMLGMALNMVWPTKFESSTEFVLNESRIVTDEAILGELEDLPLQRKQAALQAELQSTKRIGAVMDELQWPVWLESVRSPAERRRLVRKLQDNLDVTMTSNVKGGLNVTITFQWTSPQQAKEFVNLMRDSWIKLVLDAYRKGVDGRKEGAEQRMLERRSEYEAALAAKQKYEEEQNVPGLLDAEKNADLIGELMLRISDHQAKLESAVSKITALRGEMQLVPTTVMAPPPPETAEQGAALAALRTAEALLADIAEKYKPGHWRHEQASRDVAKARKELDELGGEPDRTPVEQPNPAFASLALQLNELEAQKEEYASQVSKAEEQKRQIEANNARLPRVGADLQMREADIELKRNALVAAQLELVPLQNQAQALRAQVGVLNAGTGGGVVSTGGAFEILDVGIEPDAPVLPIGAVIMALSLVLGIGLGLSGPVLGEMTRSSFGSVKEVNRHLGVPVLGAVDLILTARDVRARRVQSVLTLATMALVLAALGAALYMYANARDSLPGEVIRAIKDLQLALT